MRAPHEPRLPGVPRSCAGANRRLRLLASPRRSRRGKLRAVAVAGRSACGSRPPRALPARPLPVPSPLQARKEAGAGREGLPPRPPPARQLPLRLRRPGRVFRTLRVSVPGVAPRPRSCGFPVKVGVRTQVLFSV